MNQFIASEARQLLNDIVDNVDGVEISPQQWDAVLEVSQSKDCKSTSFASVFGYVYYCIWP